MTDADVRTVAAIMLTADNGCSFCASELLRALAENYPHFIEVIDEVWVNEGYDSMTWTKDQG